MVVDQEQADCKSAFSPRGWDIGEPRVEDKGHDQTVFSDEYFASVPGSTV